VLWQHIMLCCGAVARCASYDAHLATAPQHIPTHHDMLPQHLVCKYELNCEYYNITLERNKAPWWCSDKIETWRSVLKCFKSALCEIICAFVFDGLRWFCENIRCYNKILLLCLCILIVVLYNLILVLNTSYHIKGQTKKKTVRHDVVFHKTLAARSNYISVIITIGQAPGNNLI